mmetsp:Transcript_107946/g.322822  ORF Transcript_107946/g.322822 Transcript_107946/m.322822 type:complete len:317 (-) Transcript_107946:163-1113(-)
MQQGRQDEGQRYPDGGAAEEGKHGAHLAVETQIGHGVRWQERAQAGSRETGEHQHKHHFVNEVVAAKDLDAFPNDGAKTLRCLPFNGLWQRLREAHEGVGHLHQHERKGHGNGGVLRQQAAEGQGEAGHDDEKPQEDAEGGAPEVGLRDHIVDAGEEDRNVVEGEVHRREHEVEPQRPAPEDMEAERERGQRGEDRFCADDGTAAHGITPGTQQHSDGPSHRMGEAIAHTVVDGELGRALPAGLRGGVLVAVASVEALRKEGRHDELHAGASDAPRQGPQRHEVQEPSDPVGDAAGDGRVGKFLHLFELWPRVLCT